MYKLIALPVVITFIFICSFSIYRITSGIFNLITKILNLDFFTYDDGIILIHVYFF